MTGGKRNIVPFTTEIDVVGRSHKVVLRYFIGDPDSWNTVEFEKRQSQDVR